MLNLTTALYGRLVGSALAAHIGTRLYKGRAPQGVTWPYAVYFLINDGPMDTFSETIADVDIQFSLFSKTSGSTEIENMYTDLDTLYNNVSFSPTSETVLVMKRVVAHLTSVPEDVETGEGEYWQYDVDFGVIMVRD